MKQNSSQGMTAVERIRTDLALFSRHYEKRAEVVVETYSKLRQYRNSVFNYAKRLVRDDDPPLPELRKRVDEANAAFWDYFGPRDIYFSEDVTFAVRELAETLYKISREWLLLTEDRPAEGPGIHRADRWEKYGEPLMAKEQAAFDKLREHFQILIRAKLADRNEI